MDTTPVLLLGYNRPEKVRQAIAAISLSSPRDLLFAVDGPKGHAIDDARRVHETQNAIECIDWNCRVQTRFRTSNLGLKSAVVDAVSWAISEFDRVIVIEDDAKPGPQLIDYTTSMLHYYQSDLQIAHINGYNMVPLDKLQYPNRHSRLSRYPESYAWATWGRAWHKYDDSLSWGLNASLEVLSEITGSYVGAMRWRQIFKDASAGRIDTWAVRWLATMWSHHMWCVSPNLSLVKYDGYSGGTHTRTNKSRIQNEVSEVRLMASFDIHDQTTADPESDTWIRRSYFDDSIKGIVKTIAARNLLKLLK